MSLTMRINPESLEDKDHYHGHIDWCELRNSIKLVSQINIRWGTVRKYLWKSERMGSKENEIYLIQRQSNYYSKIPLKSSQRKTLIKCGKIVGGNQRNKTKKSWFI